MLLLDRLALQVTSPEGRGLGIGPLLAGASFLVANFATSGLETMFAATLVLLSLERAQARRPLAAGLAGIAAAMSHPDHGIFYAALGVALGWQALGGASGGKAPALADFLWYALPFVVVYLPYFVWRWRYYGDLFPNTYYAKSADLPYFRQGGIYVLSTVVIGGLWAMSPLGLLGAWHTRRSVATKFLVVACAAVPRLRREDRRRLHAGAVADLRAADRVPVRGRGIPGTAGPAPLAADRFAGGAGRSGGGPGRTIRPLEKVWNLADEGTFYRLGKFNPPTGRGPVHAAGRQPEHDAEAARADAQDRRRLRRHRRLRDAPAAVRPVRPDQPIGGPAAAAAPGAARTREAGDGGADSGRGRGFGGVPAVPRSVRSPDDAGHRGLSLLPVGLGSAVHEQAAGGGVLRGRARAGADDVLRSHPASPEVLACENWFLESFYFRKTPDPELRQRMVDRALANDSSLRGLESLMIDSRPLEGPGLQSAADGRLRAVGAVGGDRRRVPGLAPRKAVAGQGSIFGHRGNFVSTYRPVSFDAARGWMRLPPFTIKGELISLMVGGGQDVQRVRVSLVVDGQAVRSATGCGSEILGRRLWNVADFVGRTAHIEVVDDSAAGWGHLVVDEITEWRAPRRRAATP